MICKSCGAEIETGARFCPSCGVVVEAADQPHPRAGTVPGGAGQGVSRGGQSAYRKDQSAYRGSASAPWSYAAEATLPRSGRVGRNLRPLATLWLVYAGLRAVGGVIGLLVVLAIGSRHYGPLVWMVGSPVPGYLHSGAWMGFAVPAIIVSTLIACGLALATGLALLRARRGGRTLALIAAVLALFKFPLGTALGAYTLWVLASSRAGTEYDALVEP